MIKLLFVCHGNICRSPMAEFIFKDMLVRAGKSDGFLVQSAATSSEELGNPVYPPARRKLSELGISCEGKTARRVSAREYGDWDMFIGMDRENLYNLRRLFSGDPDGKVKNLADFCGKAGYEIDDPWYTGDFDTACRDITEGCLGLMQSLTDGEVTLDFGDCGSRAELWSVVSDRMLLGRGCGRNLDALWDTVSGHLPYYGRSFRVVLPAEPEIRDYAGRIADTLSDAGLECVVEDS